MKDCDSAEIAAMVNAAASMLAKGKSLEEIELMAIVSDMFSDTLFAIARIEKKREHLRVHLHRRHDSDIRRDDVL